MNTRDDFPAQLEAPADRTSCTDDVFRWVLERIGTGEWRPGTVVPSERQLAERLGVSRVPVREALSMLKGLGIVEIRQGRRTFVRQMDTGMLQQLFPLVFRLEGQESFLQIFDLRLAVESRTAFLAAERRTEADGQALAELTRQFRAHHVGESPRFVELDLAFHVRIAEATGNPFFPLLLRTFSGFVIYSQSEGCRNSLERRIRGVQAHESIVEAIIDRDAPRAQVEMEAHLRYSGSRKLKDENGTP
jgi:GntR family transcriptional regulator, transcriptional repressor for pyruvate dehydrogenase complex